MPNPNRPANLNIEEFLAQYWQQKPVLIKQAFPNFESLISAEELAGIACEQGIESRLIIEKDGQHPWQLKNGPFSEQDFTSLPDTHWTLLVQDMEKHIPQLQEIVDAFHFIPDWRLDDLMISYAPKHGSVGPHLDQYDVFLLQAEGLRRWQIDSRPDRSDQLINGIELGILEQFDAEHEWILEPGDMLYLPPGVAHHGVAMNDCMTYSIGFRSPSHMDLINAYFDTLVERGDLHTQYTDPNIPAQQNAHELTPHSLDRLRKVITEHLSLSDSTINHTIGKILSEGKPDFQATAPNPVLDKTEFLNAWKQCSILRRDSSIKFLFSTDIRVTHFFIDGFDLSFPLLDSRIAEQVCNSMEISHAEFSASDAKIELANVLYIFYQHGFYYFDGESDQD